MKIETIKLGIFQANCYILHKDKQMLCIDPGANPKKLFQYLDQFPDEELVAICLTHGHFDHIGAVDELVAKYHCPVYLSAEDSFLATHKEVNFSATRSAEISGTIKAYPEQYMKIGVFEFEILDTPGHTAGSVCLLFDGFIFTGDTLFKESVGRTDLFSGSESKLKQSLKLLKSLDMNLTVYPGHAESTSIQTELLNNPYFK